MTHKELRTILKQLSDYQVKQISQVALRFLTLNQELAEIQPDTCPYCAEQNAAFIRKGFQRGKQRFQCKSCGHKFTYLARFYITQRITQQKSRFFTSLKKSTDKTHNFVKFRGSYKSTLKPSGLN